MTVTLTSLLAFLVLACAPSAPPDHETDTAETETGSGSTSGPTGSETGETTGDTAETGETSPAFELDTGGEIWSDCQLECMNACIEHPVAGQHLCTLFEVPAAEYDRCLFTFCADTCINGFKPPACLAS